MKDTIKTLISKVSQEEADAVLLESVMTSLDKALAEYRSKGQLVKKHDDNEEFPAWHTALTSYDEILEKLVSALGKPELDLTQVVMLASMLYMRNEIYGAA